MIDFRSLMNEIHVSWTDRGRNVSAGSINIRCPFCVDDPSMHLSLSEAKQSFYCFRDGSHAGKSIPFLLHKLGVGFGEVERLIEKYRTTTRASEPVTIAPPDYSKAQKEWQKFSYATESGLIQTYLFNRGFSDPREAIFKFDLRYAPVGKWAVRMLIPFYDRGELLTWSGRSLAPHMDPKYLTNPVNDAGIVYAPLRAARAGSIALICEGPIDAMKMAYVLGPYGFFPIALTGRVQNSAKIMRLRGLLSGCQGCILCLDADVSLSQRLGIRDELRAVAGDIRMVRLPDGFKDPAELPAEEMIKWYKDDFSTPDPQ